MNSKSKIVLGLSAILAVSAGVAATSTYAWFSATRSATVSIGEITVGSKDGALSVDASNTTDGTVLDGCTASKQTITATGTAMSDVSGTGLGQVVSGTTTKPTLYSVAWKANSTNVAGTKITQVSNTTSNLYYRQFFLTFKNNGAATDNPFDVYITSGTTITPKSSSDADKLAAAAMRMSIEDSSGNLLVYWGGDYNAEPETGYGSATLPYRYNYLAPATTGTSAYGVDKYALRDASATTASDDIGAKATLPTISTGTNPKGEFTDIASADTDTLAKQKMNGATQITGGNSVTVLVRIWLEGTSTYCTDFAKGGNVSFTLAFAAQ